MNEPGATPLAARPVGGNEGTDGELCVMLDCGALVCAMPTRRIERLVLSEHAEFVTARGAAPPVSFGGDQLLSVADKRYVAWDLGELLGLGASKARSWVLLSVRHERGVLPIALRAGDCLVVAPVTATSRVPAGIFRARAGAFTAAFTPEGGRRTASAVVGVLLDPERLFSQSELDTAAATLRGELARA
jgi:hypothetical protein